MEDRIIELERQLAESEEGRAADIKLREQWLQDSRDQTAEAWAARNALWPEIHHKDAEIKQLQEHAGLLMNQLEVTEARVLRAETELRKKEQQDEH